MIIYNNSEVCAKDLTFIRKNMVFINTLYQIL